VQHGWSYLRGEFGEFVEVVPAQQQLGPLWYRGTADAVHQNIDLIVSHRPKHVLVLAGDHIYKMDYGPMIAYHVEKGADITVGVVEVPARDSQHFGVLTATEWNRVTKFAEKPATPDTLPARPDTILASMGIYVFNTRLLESLLAADATNESSAHDFGRDILPEAIAGNRQVFAYPFQDVQTRRAKLLARRRHHRCLLRRQPRAGARTPRTQHLRPGLAHLDLPGAAAAREVHS